MTRESEWRREWEVLRAERRLARGRWRSASDGLAARARDPLGLGTLVQDHPIVATGIGAAAGALLVKLFLGGAGARRDDAPPRDGAGRPQSVLSAVLRDAALGIAVPWLLRTLKEKVGWDLSPDPAPGTDPPCPQAAGPEGRAPRS